MRSFKRSGIVFVPLCVVICCVCLPYSSGDEVIASDPPVATTTQRTTIADSLRRFLNNALTGSSSTRRKIVESGISSTCSLGLIKLLKGIRNLEPWALRLIDASGKLPIGLLQGTTTEIGAYDECVETVVQDEYGNEKVRTQYCNAHIKFGNDTSLTNVVLPAMEMTHRWAEVGLRYQRDNNIEGIRIGICMLTDCTQEDLNLLVAAFVKGKARITIKNCITDQVPPMDGTQAGITAFLAVLGTALLFGTIVDILLSRRKDSPRNKSTAVKCLTSFSVLSNFKLLVAQEKNASTDTFRFRFLHGIRLFSIFWIVLGHSFVIIGNVFSRLGNLLGAVEGVPYCIVTAAYLSVDTFFFLSGFLVAYAMINQEKQRILVGVIAVIRRWIRAASPMFFVIMCLYLMPLIIHGPNTEAVFEDLYRHFGVHWWDLLLNITNLVPQLHPSVLSHLWYLSCDFQLFVISVIVLQLLKGKVRACIITFLVLSVICCAVTAGQMDNPNHDPLVPPVSETFDETFKTLTEVYILPTYHGACYFTGCIILLVLKKCKPVKLSGVTEAGFWCLCIGCGLTGILTRHCWTVPTDYKGLPAKVAFAFFDRIVWSIFIAWIVFASATGRAGFLGRFLAWPGFVPLSRLSFGVYLTHMPFYFLMHHNARERIFYSYFTLLSQTISSFVWNLGLSLLLFLVCEAPTRGLETLVFKPARRAREEQENGDCCKTNGAPPFSKPGSRQAPKISTNSKWNAFEKPKSDDDSCCHL